MKKLLLNTWSIGVFYTKPVSAGGKALFDIGELSKVIELDCSHNPKLIELGEIVRCVVLGRK